ncbi:MAG TPA: hypothetical protein VIG24_19515 [Acidimicrobiia bacterium]
MKFAVALLFTVLAVKPVQPDPVVVYETVVRTVEVERSAVPDPVQPDYMTDAEWAEFERQSECLWRLMRDRDMPITYENVVAADVWAEHNGGACLLIGEDDE